MIALSVKIGIYINSVSSLMYYTPPMELESVTNGWNQMIATRRVAFRLFAPVVAVSIHLDREGYLVLLGELDGFDHVSNTRGVDNIERKMELAIFTYAQSKKK